METKVCRKCGKEKLPNEMITGRARCRDCWNEYCRELYAKSPKARKRQLDYGHKWYAENANRAQDRQRQYRAENPDKVRTDNHRFHLKWNFGLTLEQWNQIFEAQGRKCGNPGCPNIEPGGKRQWAVDHDHRCCPGRRSCGKCIRGLLCHKCNLLLGHAHDEISVLLGAAAYLQNPPAHHLGDNRLVVVQQPSAFNDFPRILEESNSGG